MRITTILRGKEYTFETKPGLFLKDEVDSGSQMLIENMEIKDDDIVIDLGCGWGSQKKRLLDSSKKRN